MRGEEGPNSVGTPFSGAAMPQFFLQLGGAVRPPALRRARLYVDLLANPPPPPHPFGVFLEEAGRLRAATAAAPVGGSEGTSRADAVGAVGGASDAETPLLLELLRQAHGHSSGSALYRIWVWYPQEYLSWMAQQIADLVLMRAMPLICGEKQEEEISFRRDESSNTRETATSSTKHGDRYDIHVRFLPSSSSHAQVDASISESFCAEIIVRDVEVLRRLDENAALLRAQYTSVAAEGQTVQSVLAFWRSVSTEAAVEEDDRPLAGDALSDAVLLGRGSDLSAAGRVGRAPAAGDKAFWVQPPTRRPRDAGVAVGTTPAESSRSKKRAAVSEPPRASLQSAAGLVAVFYLSFSGVLYTGVVCGTTREQPRAAPEPRHAGADPDGGATRPTIDAKVEAKVEATPRQGVEPVFYLPCTASTSFVRGLLGL